MFRFKEFNIKQDKAAMKIGTDAVLIGAWTSVDNFPDSILDIGSGTGILALMMAQRSDAMTIDAVEIEDSAYEQSVENFELSDWGDRLFCYHTNFQDFTTEMIDEEETYDLIISNPPFYTDESKSNIKNRDIARSTRALSFEDLIKGASQLLSDKGLFSVIIPQKEKENFINLAKNQNLHIQRICEVKDTCTAITKRVMVEFTKHISTIKEECLILKNNPKEFTKEHIDLTKAFYLKM